MAQSSMHLKVQKGYSSLMLSMVPFCLKASPFISLNAKANIQIRPQSCRFVERGTFTHITEGFCLFLPLSPTWFALVKKLNYEKVSFQGLC